MSSSDPEPGCLFAVVSFAILGAVIVAIGISGLKVSLERKAMWEEAVKRGFAEKVNHSGGEGYRWKEPVCP